MPRDRFLSGDGVRWAANTIRDEAAQMQKAIESAKSVVEPCRKVLAPQIKNGMQAWDENKASLDLAVAKAREAVAALDRIAEAIDRVAWP